MNKLKEIPIPEPPIIPKKEPITKDYSCCLAFAWAVRQGDFILTKIEGGRMRYRTNLAGNFISFCPFCSKYLYREKSNERYQRRRRGEVK